MSQVTVITGVERRRVWTDDQKLDLIEATMEPGANVSEIARAADIAPAQLYRWRKELLDPDPDPDGGEEGFVPVMIDSSAPPVPVSPGFATVIELQVDGAVIRIAAAAPSALVAATLEGLRR